MIPQVFEQAPAAQHQAPCQPHMILKLAAVCSCQPMRSALHIGAKVCPPYAKEGPQAAGGLLMESLEVSMVAGGSHGMRMGMPGTRPLPLGMLL